MPHRNLEGKQGLNGWGPYPATLFFFTTISHAKLLWPVSQIPFAFSWPACEQALRGAVAVGREKERELSTTLEFECHFQFPCGSPSTELSDFRQSVRSGNERECKQT